MFLRKFYQSFNLPEKYDSLAKFLHRSRTLTLSTSTQSSQDIFEKWKRRFEEEKVPEIPSSINNILAHILGVRKVSDLDISTLTPAQIKKFEKLCECRVARMPIQYIIGQWEFCDLTLKMIPPVFIPRPETEELVELILQQVNVKKRIHFLELGCGSGAISLALLNALPMAKCTAVDQSKLACDLTAQNAKTLELSDRITILNQKLTTENQLNDLEIDFDLIVSNPPYIKTKELIKLAPEIKLYEDLRALDGGSDGLDIVKLILHLAAAKLKPTGTIWLEIDPGQPALIESYIKTNESTLPLKYVSSYQDLFRKERFVEIVKP